MIFPFAKLGFGFVCFTGAKYGNLRSGTELRHRRTELVLHAG
jgi:hypothetical protein